MAKPARRILETEPPLLTRTFNPGVTRTLRTKLMDLPPPHENIERALANARKIVSSMAPLDSLEVIRTFRCDPSAPGVLLLQGLPIDRFLPATPLDGHPSNAKRTFVSEHILLWVAQELGEPFAFIEEKNGNLVHDVAPNPNKRKSRSNEGSENDLGFHNEVAVSAHRPDHLALLCLKSDREGKAVTYSADIARASYYLSPATIDDLRREEFALDAPESFGSTGATRRQVAVIEGPDKYLEVRVNFDRMKGTTGRARRALRNLEHAFRQPDVLRQTLLRPGDLLIVANRKAVHARTRFDAHFDGHDRWLQRIYAAGTLWPMRSPDNSSSRVLSIHGDY